MTQVKEKSPDEGDPSSRPGMAELRRRFVEIARRRVPREAAEDLAQEALRIVVEKGVQIGSPAASGRPPALAFSFQVLRNVIGNYYQRSARRPVAAEAEPDERAADTPTPLEALLAAERTRHIAEALRRLAEADGSCARYLSGLVEGRKPNELAGAEGVDPAAFYRRLYRCRAKLRTMLADRGIRV